jgi:hypothetical protein
MLKLDPETRVPGCYYTGGVDGDEEKRSRNRRSGFELLRPDRPFR